MPLVSICRRTKAPTREGSKDRGKRHSLLSGVKALDGKVTELVVGHLKEDERTVPARRFVRKWHCERRRPSQRVEHGREGRSRSQTHPIALVEDGAHLVQPLRGGASVSGGRAGGRERGLES